MLVAKTLEIILASTLTSEIGLQFSKRERSFPFCSLMESDHRLFLGA